MTIPAPGIDLGHPEVLIGRRLSLKHFTGEHVTDRYLSWLGSDSVNRYSRRFQQPAETREQALAWITRRQKDEIVLAMETAADGHIGNIKYGPINWSNLAADLSIMIGAVDTWGKGYGAEAIYLVTKHLFFDRGLNRVQAASINPAFIRIVEKLGWQREGVQREESRVGGVFYDSILLSHLRREFVTLRQYEAS